MSLPQDQFLEDPREILYEIRDVNVGERLPESARVEHEKDDALINTYGEWQVGDYLDLIIDFKGELYTFLRRPQDKNYRGHRKGVYQKLLGHLREYEICESYDTIVKREGPVDDIPTFVLVGPDRDLPLDTPLLTKIIEIHTRPGENGSTNIGIFVVRSKA